MRDVIVGVGIDVVGIERFAAVLARTPSMRSRLFTECERGLPVQSLAGRFAVKEALAKALGAPGGLSWTDAEVRSGSRGEPVLEVAGGVRERARALQVDRLHVSISHDGGIATAIVIAESTQSTNGKELV